MTTFFTIILSHGVLANSPTMFIVSRDANNDVLRLLKTSTGGVSVRHERVWNLVDSSNELVDLRKTARAHAGQHMRAGETMRALGRRDVQSETNRGSTSARTFAYLMPRPRSSSQ